MKIEEPKIKIKKPEFWIEAEKKLKKIWDLLQDKRVVRFTLSVKLYPDGLSAPKTASIHGERSAESEWNIWTPRDQNSAVLRSSETLKGNLARIEEQVREYIVENALDAAWKKQEILVRRALKFGISVADLEYRSEVPVRAIASYGYKAHLCAPSMATAYVKKGTEALVKNDLDYASHCVDRGLYWSDSQRFIPNPQDRFTERASEGGQGRAFRHEPVKNKVAELLMKLAPKEGWGSTPAAIEAVAKKLTFNHSSFVEDCGLKTHNLPKTIGGWVQADPERFPHRIKAKT